MKIPNKKQRIQIHNIFIKAADKLECGDAGWACAAISDATGRCSDELYQLVDRFWEAWLRPRTRKEARAELDTWHAGYWWPLFVFRRGCNHWNNEPRYIALYLAAQLALESKNWKNMPT